MPTSTSPPLTRSARVESGLTAKVAPWARTAAPPVCSARHPAAAARAAWFMPRIIEPRPGTGGPGTGGLFFPRVPDFDGLPLGDGAEAQVARRDHRIRRGRLDHRALVPRLSVHGVVGLQLELLRLLVEGAGL